VEVAVDILVVVPLVDLVDNSPEVEVRSLKKERAQATTHSKSQKLCTKNPKDLLPFFAKNESTKPTRNSNGGQKPLKNTFSPSLSVCLSVSLCELSLETFTQQNIEESGALHTLRGIPIRLLGWVSLGWIPSLGSHDVKPIGCRGTARYFSLAPHSCLFALASLTLSCLYSTKETLPLSFSSSFSIRANVQAKKQGTWKELWFSSDPSKKYINEESRRRLCCAHEHDEEWGRRRRWRSEVQAQEEEDDDEGGWGNRGSGPRGSCAVWPSFRAGPTYVPIY
jgi:hypothetical protein